MPRPHHHMLRTVMYAIICVTNVLLCYFIGDLLPSMMFQGILIAWFAFFTIWNILKYNIAEEKIVNVLSFIKVLNDLEMKITAAAIRGGDRNYDDDSD